MTRWVAATDLRIGDHFTLDGREHVALRVIHRTTLVWVTTDAGELLPVYGMERVLLAA